MAYISFQPNDNFKTLIWTGTDAARTLTGVGFQPDCTWIKNRDAAYNHVLWDAVRTGGSNKAIAPNTNGAEGAPNSAAYGYLNAFTSDGYSLGEGSSNDSYVNTTGTDYVSWNWKAGTTTGIDATGADITPTGYSFNQTSGFSIIDFEGTGTQPVTFPHGLGAVPEMVILKSIDNATDWTVYHHNMTITGNANTRAVELNTDTAVASVNYWKDTTPTSVLFTLGNDAQVNPTSTMIAYCFTGKKGYSKFGQYVGNGDTDGTFVYTGFRPALIITRDYANTESWGVYDNKRLGYNYKNWFLNTNDDRAEGESVYPDILSNGFKWRHGDGMINGSGKSYIYAAFAEFPTVSSNNIPGLAR